MRVVKVIPVAALVVFLGHAALGGEPITIGERLTVASKVLGEERTILVSTPLGYGRGQQRYPVLYLTDGDAHLTHTRGTVDFLARNGLMPQVIIVGIVNTDRNRDLTPSRVPVRTLGERTFQLPTSGGADKFLTFIETELVPWVEASYRTERFRILCGHSFGGLFATHALLTRPELFHAIIAVSPTLAWDDDLMLKRGKRFFAERADLKRAFFMTLGNEGDQGRVAFDRFAKILKSNKASGFRWGTMILEDEDHGSAVLRSHYYGLKMIYEGWRMPKDPATGDFVGRVADLKKHYADVSERLGLAVSPPEQVVNQMGYQALQRQDRAHALEFFRFNVASYPDSANVYDSLGEGLEQDGQLDVALENYRTAYQIGVKSGDPNTQIYKQHLEHLSGKPADQK
jgi:predicted alpha/beta superfamily hydrolase